MTIQASSQSNRIVLDVPDMDVGPDGIADFFWPLPWSDFLSARDRFLNLAAAALRAGVSAGNSDYEVISAVFVQYIQEVVRAYYLTAVKRRFAAGSYQIISQNPALARQAFTPRGEKSDRIAFLYNRFRSSMLRGLFRPLLGLRANDGMSWRYPGLVDMKSSIIATNNSPLMQVRAREQDETVYLVSMRYWFGDVADELTKRGPSQPAASAAIDEILHATSQAFLAGKETLPDDVAAYLRDWLMTATAIAGFYIAGLLVKPERLPKRLWTGSAGYIFRRIMYFAVRRENGHVTSHDHGSGLGYLSIIDPNFTEFITTDRFVTFTEHQAQSYRGLLREEYRIRLQWPEICSHIPKHPSAREDGAAGASDSSDRRVKPPASGSLRIMYVASQYRGEFQGLTPIEFDMVAVDWQARLFAQLKAQGHLVINKAHPSSPAPPPNSFERRLGIPPVLTPFETQIDTADVFLFNSADTSAFKPAVKSNKPIVLIDFGVPQWEPVALALSSRRCAVVRGWFDESGRAQIRWEDLFRAISDASQLVADTTFASTYFD